MKITFEQGWSARPPSQSLWPRYCWDMTSQKAINRLADAIERNKKGEKQ